MFKNTLISGKILMCLNYNTIWFKDEFMGIKKDVRLECKECREIN